MAKVFNFLTESVRQPGKPAHRHAHGQVGPFNVARRNMASVWMPRNNRCRGPQTHRWTVPDLFLGFTINLDQCCVVNIASEPTSCYSGISPHSRRILADRGDAHVTRGKIPRRESQFQR
jgi:hypothetical protein